MKKKQPTTPIRPNKFIFIFFSLLILNGCVKEVISPERDFRFITVQSGETMDSLAQKHLGSSSLAWRIAEFNGVTEITPGQNLVIPLQPFRPGGLTAAGHQLVSVLSYHNFSRSESHSKLSVSASTFDSQMQYLQNNGFHVLSLNEFLEYLQFGQIPRKSVLITIDDGWISCYDIAYPILQKYGFNAVLFIPTSFINARSTKTLNWNQIREMVNDNSIDIQCHTKSHRDLNEMKRGQSFSHYIDEVKNELLTAQKIIFEKSGQKVTALAYPYGNTNPVVMEILKQNDYNSAFTVKRNGNPFYIDDFKINRSMIYGTFRLNKFIENLRIYEDDPLESVEPIDTMQSIDDISYQSPAEYENKQQWRTALLAWTLHRDWLLSFQNNHTTNDKLPSLTNTDSQLAEATQKVRELQLKTLGIAAKLFSQAIKTNDINQSRQLLLRTLLYNPDHQTALEQLKNSEFNQYLMSYWVKNDDTLDKISQNLYHDKTKTALIELFNQDINQNSKLSPGMKLRLPTVKALSVIKVDGSTHCNIVLTKPAKQLAEELYRAANKLFNQDKIKQAIGKLQTAICLDPGHQAAKEMLDMLEHL